MMRMPNERPRNARSKFPCDKLAVAADLEYVMSIDFWQSIRGTQTKVNITRYDVCETCHVYFSDDLKPLAHVIG